MVVNKCHATRGGTQSKPQTPRAERRVTGFSVVTILVWFSHYTTRGRGQAESPAFRAPLFQGQSSGELDYGRPRAG